MADAEGNGNGNGGAHLDPLAIYPTSRAVTRRAAPDRREPAPELERLADERLAEVGRDLHAAALLREGVRRIILTLDIRDRLSPRLRCVRDIRETVELSIDPLVKR